MNRRLPIERKRRRVFGLLIAPFAVLVWLIGWSLYCVGEAKEYLKPKRSNRGEKLALEAFFVSSKIEQ